MNSENLPLIVLASGSPRRRQILDYLEIDHQVVKSDVDERSIKASSPREFALKAAFAKAHGVHAGFPTGTILIAADTVVALNGRIYFKPTDAEDAVAMLSELSGKTHQVVTAIAVREYGHATQLDAVSTSVTFRSLNPDEIQKYVDTGEPLDKAGSYGIQGNGAALVEGIVGDYYNVVGLPVEKLLDMLSSHWDVSGHRAKAVSLTPSIFV